MSNLTESRSGARAISYLRVSSKRQMDTAIDIDPDGNSIATQRDYVGRRASALETGIRREFVEPGNSAQTIEKRPVFRELLAYVQAHRGEIDYVIIYQRSRAFRNLGDAVITERALNKLGVKLISAKEDFGDGIFGDAMKSMVDIINELQVRMSGEDIRIKMEHKARSGGTIGRARLGYKNVRTDVEGRYVNSIAVDEERAPLVRQAFEIYARGDVSLEGLAEAMDDLGLTSRPTAKWSAKAVTDSKLHSMLKDPYYLGFVVYNGELIQGRHEPIVTQSLFDEVQDVLAARSSNGQRDRKLVHYLKGMVFCDRCYQAGRTNRLIYTEVKGRNGTVYEYLLCRGRQKGECDLPHLSVALVERGIEKEYANLVTHETYGAALSAELEQALEDSQETTRTLHASYRKQLTKLDVQEERLLELAADGDLPQARIRAKLAKITMDRRSIEEGLRQTGDELAVGADLLRTAIELTQDPERLYLAAPAKTRRAMNETFFEAFYIDEFGNTARAVRRPPFDDLADGQSAFFRRRNMGATERAHEQTHPPLERVTGMDTRTSTRTGLRVDLVGGSSRDVLVDLSGICAYLRDCRTSGRER